MPTYKEIFEKIDKYYELKLYWQGQSQKNNSATDIPPAAKDETHQFIGKQLAQLESKKDEILKELVMFPPHKDKHFQRLVDFYTDGDFKESVFIMTKFPDIQNPQPIDYELIRVIDSVKAAIQAKGYKPRMANSKRFHPALWDNVELYLLGCMRGVAIVEDKYKKELNPNVAMEWGWMRGMDRDVLYLVENSFAGERADIVGLLKDNFDWANPEPGITNAINGWL